MGWRVVEEASMHVSRVQLDVVTAMGLKVVAIHVPYAIAAVCISTCNLKAAVAASAPGGAPRIDAIPVTDASWRGAETVARDRVAGDGGIHVFDILRGGCR